MLLWDLCQKGEGEGEREKNGRMLWLMALECVGSLAKQQSTLLVAHSLPPSPSSFPLSSLKPAWYCASRSSPLGSYYLMWSKSVGRLCELGHHTLHNHSHEFHETDELTGIYFMPSITQRIGQRHIPAISLFQNGRPLETFFLQNRSHSSRAPVALPGKTLDGPDEKFRAN